MTHIRRIIIAMPVVFSIYCIALNYWKYVVFVVPKVKHETLRNSEVAWYQDGAILLKEAKMLEDYFFVGACVSLGGLILLFIAWRLKKSGWMPVFYGLFLTAQITMVMLTSGLLGRMVDMAVYAPLLMLSDDRIEKTYEAVVKCGAEECVKTNMRSLSEPY